MRVIWKYPLDIFAGFTQRLDIPNGIVRHVGQQDGCIMLWIEVDPTAEKKCRTFQIVGTGDPSIGEGFAYHGTVQIKAFVWHVYETTWAVKDE